MAKQEDLSKELESHRDYLNRFAQFLLRDAALVEDAVQETFMAALSHKGAFEGRSQLRTWLTAILKHKVVDLVRKRHRGPPIAEATDYLEEGAAEGAFGPDGQWVEAPAAWGRPDAALESSQFWQVYLKCCEVMPERHALVFSMREVMGMSSAEICKELALSASNLHVILFRARLSLRTCMTKNWFGGEHG